MICLTWVASVCHNLSSKNQTHEWSLEIFMRARCKRLQCLIQPCSLIWHGQQAGNNIQGQDDWHEECDSDTVWCCCWCCCHECRSSDRPGQARTSDTKDEDSYKTNGWVMYTWGGSLTSHFDSGKVSPGFSSPAGLVAGWGSAGGIGIGIGRGMGWLWPSGLSGPRLDVGWPMITV